MKLLKKPVMYVVMALLAMSLLFVFVSAASKKPRLSKKKVTMYVGQTYKLKAKGFKGKVKWKSSNKKIAMVNKKGKITAKKKGTVKIIAKYKKVKKVCKVTIVSKEEYKNIIDNKNKPEPTVAPVITTAPQITTVPATTIEGETTTVIETTSGVETTTEEETTEEEELNKSKYVKQGMVFYDNIMTYPNSESSITVYELIDADQAWGRYHILRGQFLQLSDILTDLQSKGYVSSNSLEGGVPQGAVKRNEYCSFSYDEQILTYTSEYGQVTNYKILDFNRSWERFNVLITRDKEEEFNPDKIINDLRSKGYIN